MEWVRCNLCGLDEAEVLFKKAERFGIDREGFQVVRCSGCGLLYVNPRPTEREMGRYYPEAYSWRETLRASSCLTRLIRRLEKWYRYHLLRDEVSKVIRLTGRTSGRALDIGCGTGDRLDVFRQSGFETFGVETSSSADYASSFLGLNIHKGDLFSARFPDRFFDLVTLYHVLEHTPDPSAICQEVERILKEDGYFVVQVPNRDSLQYRIFGKRWAAFDVPRDLYYFDPRTLGAILERVGFRVRKIDHFMHWWHPPTLVLSLFPQLNPQESWAREEKGKGTLFSRVAWMVLTLLSGPLTSLESLMKRGAIITCYAIKGARDKLTEKG